ncbi:mitochondrial ubiquitin ligase activator of nfkb 1-A [Menidia menidia]
MGDSPINSLVLLGIGSSFAFSGVFYHLYKEKKKELQKLKEIPFFKPDHHLLNVLNSTSQKRLQYVAVEGQVQADGEPLASQFVPRCFGVLQKIVVGDHWKYWNAATGTWNSRTRNMKETNNSVPFSLISAGSFISDVCVKVHKPLEASGCFLERVHFRTKRAEEGLMNVVVSELTGEKPVAKEECEEMLRVGTTVTGFGEVVLEGGHSMRLQAPPDGRSYVLVPGDYRSFIDRHEASASMWRNLAAATGITGTSILLCLLYNLSGKQDDRKK